MFVQMSCSSLSTVSSLRLRVTRGPCRVLFFFRRRVGTSCVVVTVVGAAAAASGSVPTDSATANEGGGGDVTAPSSSSSSSTWLISALSLSIVLLTMSEDSSRESLMLWKPSSEVWEELELKWKKHRINSKIYLIRPIYQSCKLVEQFFILW